METVGFSGCTFSFLESFLKFVAVVQLKVSHDIGGESIVEVDMSRGVIKVLMTRRSVPDVFICCNVFFVVSCHFELLEFLSNHVVDVL